MDTRRRGFTLIELLVVIAIIGILAGMLFPVFGRARERGRTVACLNNLNQLSKAVLMYMDDNGGRFPIALPSGTMGPSWCGYNPSTATLDVRQGSLWAYVKSAEVFLCPSDGWGSRLGLSYQMSGPLSIMPEGQVDAPTQTVLLLDSSDYCQCDEVHRQDGEFQVSPNAPDELVIIASSERDQNSPTDGFNAVHAQKANAAYVDGHVRTFQPGELKAGHFRPFASF